MTLVKICGITNVEDALHSVSAGADMLGFNFFPRSPRYIPPDEARQIIDQLPADLLTFGVFVNEVTPERVMEIASLAGVTGVQLHGDETPEYCGACMDRYVVKSFAVGDDFAPAKVLKYNVNAIMLDASHGELRGGTGRLADWNLARQTQRFGARIFLAGGLSPANVVEAIKCVEPYAVDACSLLEERPGKKDNQLVRQFIQLVHSVKP
jgi:phosphoribosylanthranilate isomerase